MSTVEDRVNRMREERLAREKARIEKLRELNLKKYYKDETPKPHAHAIPKTTSVSSIKNVPAPVKNQYHVSKRPITAPITTLPTKSTLKTNTTAMKVNRSVNNTKITNKMYVIDKKTQLTEKKTEKTQVIHQKSLPIDQEIIKKMQLTDNLTEVAHKRTQLLDQKTHVIDNNTQTIEKTNLTDAEKKSQIENKPKVEKKIQILDKPKENKSSLLRLKKDVKTDLTQKHSNVTQRKSMAPKFDMVKSNAEDKIDSRILKEIKPKENKNNKTLSKFAMKNAMRKSMSAASQPAEKPTLARKSMIPKSDVFERLYKPKIDHKKTVSDVDKLKSDPKYLNAAIKSSNMIFNKNFAKPVRRSISAVHFKRVDKSEIQNCIHKWSSIGDNLNKAHLRSEDDIIPEEVTSAVKSEMKKVKFMTPMSVMTPRPDELQARLKNWLQKRGKSLDSYHHLQCFGIHHLSRDTPKLDLYDEENKENIAVDSDSDDGSFNDNMNELDKTSNEANKTSYETNKTYEDNKTSNIANKTPNDFHKIDIDEWRRVSGVSESVDFNESLNLNETTFTSADTYNAADELVIGAMNDLAELLREGFDYEQSARWLRAIRGRFPDVTSTAAYWECRAALEERRGDFPASVQCWEEALAVGIERSVVETNLDQLLDKFMQLKISPSGNKQTQPNPRMVDVKNVFKSTIIRFAVQHAKLRESQTPVVTVTPVRRSARLSHANNQNVCQSLKQVSKMVPQHLFTPNRNLITSP